MKVGIVANPEIKGLEGFLKRTLEALKGHEVFLESGIAKKYPKLEKKIEEFDVDAIITFGGDGTVLYTLQNMPAQVPILPIRAGLIGFLTEIDKADLEDGIGRLVKGDYVLEERMRISSKVNGRRLPDALNEVVIHTSQVAKLRHFKVKVDGELAFTIRSDGIIIATPTGSTSYSLSVGAPILDSRLDAMVIAPIAPLWNMAKPMVVPGSSNIQITLDAPRPCSVVADGRDEVEFEGGERVELFKSSEPAKFVRFDTNFFQRLRKKLQAATGMQITSH
ncbi:MAG TPA: hypothetical protein ENN25_01760 [Euryarchaeota archaeon]|nr:hypothetical protein [Euryarchaeota archaeon]